MAPCCLHEVVQIKPAVLAEMKVEAAKGYSFCHCSVVSYWLYFVSSLTSMKCLFTRGKCAANNSSLAHVSHTFSWQLTQSEQFLLCVVIAKNTSKEQSPFWWRPLHFKWTNLLLFFVVCLTVFVKLCVQCTHLFLLSFVSLKNKVVTLVKFHTFST